TRRSVRFQTRTSKPAVARLRAIGAPIVPVPKNATTVMVPTISLRRIRSLAVRFRHGAYGPNAAEEGAAAGAAAARDANRRPTRRRDDPALRREILGVSAARAPCRRHRPDRDRQERRARDRG